ncbi:Ribonuclease H-like protein [Dioscorea alata]|uniref:Ribonuclease H-like protein n=1 Tax=Dioscorea alata TaxID=55571 RepID=A0ACB7UC47_DIOAL|nr:Ribonuclease H-like protein [Dioscorea alata]
MLEDIGHLLVHANTLSKAKQITTFIYRHTLLINMIRKFANSYDLIRAGVTRFATSYLTLSRMHELKMILRSMFVSEEWLNSPFAKKSDGKKVENLGGDAKFWDAIVFCLKSVIPLVKVLRLVDGDAKSAMGYTFEAMDRAKEKIAKNFDDVSSRYKEYGR